MRDRDDGGDRFRVLYEKHHADVLRYVVRRAGPDAGADVTAETFLTAWRRLEVVPESDPLPWLYAAARRCLANEMRSRARSERLGVRIRALASPAADEVSESVATRFDVLAALATLSVKDQEALRLTEWEQLDGSRAAAAAGCTTTAFKVRLHRARRRLAQALDRQAGETAETATAEVSR